MRKVFVFIFFTNSLFATMRIDLGGATGFSLNSARSQYTTTENRFGLGFVTNIEMKMGDYDLAFLLAFMRNQSLVQNQDGASNPEICKESFGTKFTGFPGPCGQLQLRMQPMIWVGNWGGGVTLVFNHMGNYSYKENTIYNTKWNYFALGLVGAYRLRWNRFSLVPAIHFDYSVDSSSPLLQKIQAWQMGVNIYAMYAIF